MCFWSPQISSNVSKRMIMLLTCLYNLSVFIIIADIHTFKQCKRVFGNASAFWPFGMIQLQRRTIWARRGHSTWVIYLFFTSELSTAFELLPFGQEYFQLPQFVPHQTHHKISQHDHHLLAFLCYWLVIWNTEPQYFQSIIALIWFWHI